MASDSNHQASYVIFVDEAGDPGIRSVKPRVADGASEWFTMGAVVIDQSRDAETVDWVREIKDAVKQHQKPYFHYKDVPSGARRLRACEILATKPCRLLAVVSHKPNMSGYANPRPESRGGQHVFYNWVLRVLLERASNYVREHSLKRYGEVRRARLVLSSAGGLNYGQLKAYHEVLKLQGHNAYLNRRTIAWDVLTQRLYEAVPARANAGVQLADIVASAFYQAAHVDGANWDLAPALALRPRLVTSCGFAEDEGLTLLPFQKSLRKLDASRRQIFERYGFDLG